MDNESETVSPFKETCFKIVNFVVSAKILTNNETSKTLDLQLLSEKFSVAYNPKKFTGLIARYNRPKSTCLLFKNGKINSVGNNSFQRAKLSLRRTLKKVRKVYPQAEIRDVNVQNIVGSGKMKFKINFDKLLEVVGSKQMTYEPELFPAAKIDFPDFKAVCRVFHTGSFFITGVKNELDLFIVLQQLYDICINATK